MNEEILFRYIQELSDPTEREIVAAWLQQSQRNRDILTALAKRKQTLEAAADQHTAEQYWQKVQESLEASGDGPRTGRLFHLWRYSAAAALALLLAVMGWMWKRPVPHKPQPIQLATSARDKKNVVLPDGTQVWLQYNSVLEYDAAAFNTDNRRVTLRGEAFFDVATNAGKPFQVNTRLSGITVLGTSFQVTARENMKQEIAVASGKIQVDAGGKSIQLLPLQRATIDPLTSTMVTDSASMQYILATRNNQLVFENDDLYSIAGKLQHWYNRRVIIHGKPQHVSFTGNIQDHGMQQVLDGLSFLAGTQYEIHADSIVLSIKSNFKNK